MSSSTMPTGSAQQAQAIVESLIRFSSCLAKAAMMSMSFFFLQAVLAWHGWLSLFCPSALPGDGVELSERLPTRMRSAGQHSDIFALIKMFLSDSLQS